MSIVYLNGEYLPLAKATVSVMDRGFLFGDGVYEVVPVYNKKLFRAKEHLDRLQRSLDAVQIDLHVDHAAFTDIFDKLLQQNNAADKNAMVYLQITRGAASTRTHFYPKNSKPTIFISTSTMPSHTLDELKQGTKAITLPDERWVNCYIKSLNLLPNVMASQTAKESDAKDAILIRDGLVIEAASSNVCIVKNNQVITAPEQKGMLGGVTRNLALELMQKNNINYVERPITEDELNHADEIWLLSSTKEILPVLQLNDKTVGNGKAGVVWQEIIKYYQTYKANY